MLLKCFTFYFGKSRFAKLLSMVHIYGHPQSAWKVIFKTPYSLFSTQLIKKRWLGNYNKTLLLHGNMLKINLCHCDSTQTLMIECCLENLLNGEKDKNFCNERYSR